ncbi:hypothetical protein ACFSZS_25950 [Seohaeicola zhoushanensis]
MLLAELPELGRLDRRAVAALAGLAPYDRERPLARQAPHRGRPRRAAPGALFRGHARQPGPRRAETLPRPAGRPRQTRQARHRRGRPKAAHHAQRHDPRRHRLRRNGVKNTVAGGI